MPDTGGRAAGTCTTPQCNFSTAFAFKRLFVQCRTAHNVSIRIASGVETSIRETSLGQMPEKLSEEDALILLSDVRFTQHRSIFQNIMDIMSYTKI